MSGANSPILKRTTTESWSCDRELLESDLFSSLASRLVRRAIASQFIKDDHPVLSEEDRLIEKSTKEIREYLSATTHRWGPNMGLAKLAIMKHIREEALSRLSLHDIDDQTRNEASNRILKTDLTAVFPDYWEDC